MHQSRRSAAVAAASLLSGLLAACGGGGGSPPPSPAPVVDKLMRAKWMILSWAQVPGATSYRLMRDADGLSGFASWTELGSSQTSLHVDLPVHLIDRVNSRYRVDACNDAGCTPSAVIFLTPRDQRDATGYFKASNPGPNDAFGFSAALSGDGRRMAIGAPREDSAASGIDGGQAAAGNTLKLRYVCALPEG